MGSEKTLNDRLAQFRGGISGDFGGGGGGGGQQAVPPPPVEAEVAWKTFKSGLVAAATKVFFGQGSDIFTAGQTEVNARYRAPSTRTIQKGKINVKDNAANGPIVVTIRVNGIDTGVTATIGIGVTGNVDMTGTAAVSEGDLVSAAVDYTAVGFGVANFTCTYELA